MPASSQDDFIADDDVTRVEMLDYATFRHAAMRHAAKVMLFAILFFIFRCCHARFSAMLIRHATLLRHRAAMLIRAIA